MLNGRCSHPVLQTAMGFRGCAPPRWSSLRLRAKTQRWEGGTHWVCAHPTWAHRDPHCSRNNYGGRSVHARHGSKRCASTDSCAPHHSPVRCQCPCLSLTAEEPESQRSQVRQTAVCTPLPTFPGSDHTWKPLCHAIPCGAHRQFPAPWSGGWLWTCFGC